MVAINMETNLIINSCLHTYSDEPGEIIIVIYGIKGYLKSNSNPAIVQKMNRNVRSWIVAPPLLLSFLFGLGTTLLGSVFRFPVVTVIPSSSGDVSVAPAQNKITQLEA